MRCNYNSVCPNVTILNVPTDFRFQHHFQEEDVDDKLMTHYSVGATLEMTIDGSAVGSMQVIKISMNKYSTFST